MCYELVVASWIAVVGTGQSNRDQVIGHLEARFGRAGIAIGGFRQLRCHEINGETISGYDLVRIGSGADRIELARPAREPELCGWGFERAAFEQADQWLNDGSLVSFATAGPLECRRDGHWASIERRMTKPGLVVLSLRPHSLTKIVLALPDPVDAIELPASDNEAEAFLHRCAQWVQLRLRSEACIAAQRSS